MSGTNNVIIAEQIGGNGNIELRHIHNKFKNLVIPAGLSLYDGDHHHHHHNVGCDIIHHNEQIHNSLYDRLLELASYDDSVKQKEKNKTDEKNSEKKKDIIENVNVKLKIKPVMSQTQAQHTEGAQVDGNKRKLTKRKKNNSKQKQTRRRLN
jgi:hypothetical protein